MERQETIKKEIQKLTHARFISEVIHPKWLANVVLVKRANEKWRVYVDFTDLNKAYPKDIYSLPIIDQLVDSTVGYKLLNFLDAYLSYHQIFMTIEDKEKTSFITD